MAVPTILGDSLIVINNRKGQKPEQLPSFFDDFELKRIINSLGAEPAKMRKSGEFTRYGAI